MSRLYDALKQASRLKWNDSTRSDSSIEDDGEIAGFENIRVSPAALSLDVEEVIGQSAVLTATASTPDGWMTSPEPEADDRISSDDRTLFCASSANVRLDSGARVLPNGVDPIVVEHYRHLRTKIIQQHAAKPFRSLLVTSANPQEGKTVTVLNLALSFAMLPSFKILVIDGDLRRGSLGKWLGMSSHPGLSNLIEGSASVNDTILKGEDIPIHFMVSGTSTVPPAELLHSRELSVKVRQITKHFDLVLFDSAPVNPITDTQLLAKSCDAILVVARAFATTRKPLEKAVHDLLPFRIIGTVLNGGGRTHLYRHSGYY